MDNEKNNTTKDEKKGLLESIFDCFISLDLFGVEKVVLKDDDDDSKSSVEYYKNPRPSNISDKWRMFFCDDIYSLSIPKRSEDKDKPSENFLGYVKREEVKSQSVATIKNRFIKTFKKKELAHTIIDRQVEYLKDLVEMSVRFDWSIKCGEYKNKVLENDLISRCDQQVEIYHKEDNLKDEFTRSAMSILEKRNEDVYLLVKKILPEKISNYEDERLFFSLISSVMVLCLNIRDTNPVQEEKQIPESDNERVDKVIKEYIVKAKYGSGCTWERNFYDEQNDRIIEEKTTKTGFFKFIVKNDEEDIERCWEIIIASDDTIFLKETYREFRARIDLFFRNYFIDGTFSEWIAKIEHLMYELKVSDKTESIKYDICDAMINYIKMIKYKNRIISLKQSLVNGHLSDITDKTIELIGKLEKQVAKKEMQYIYKDKNIEEKSYHGEYGKNI